MWTSLYNFFCKKLFHRPELGFPRSDDSCGAYGKRLKYNDRLWKSISMQKENFDISDDEEDCCIIAEIPRRKKPVNSIPVQKTNLPPGKSSDFPQSFSTFSFKKDSQNENTEVKPKKDVKLIVKLSEKDANIKIQPRKFFTTQRTFSQGKLARSKATERNHLKKKLNFLQESYRLTEKLQYINLLQSHTTYKLMTVGQPFKSLKPPENQIHVIDLCNDDTDEIHECTSKKGNLEEQDIQIVGEISGTNRSRSFQDVLRNRPLNVDLALKAVSLDKTQCSSDVSKLLVRRNNLLEDDINNENEKTDALEDKLRNFMQITAPVVHEVENTEFHYLPEFTWEQEKKIQRALELEPSQEVLSEGFGLKITRLDMQTLVGLNWLNDEIINFYMNLIMERSKLGNGLPKVYAFNTFFYPKLVSDGHGSLKRWTKKVDIFSFDMILVPIHLGMHWCLAVIDFRSKSINYYDSVGSPNHQCLERLLLYLKAESLDKRKRVLPTTNWKKSNVEDIPQQMNGGDCGVFSCMFAEYLARDCRILFTQDDMPYFRKKMVIEICEKKLLT